VHIVNTVHVKASKTQLEGILYYPNPYPSIHPRNVRLADFNRRGSTSYSPTIRNCSLDSYTRRESWDYHRLSQARQIREETRSAFVRSRSSARFNLAIAREFELLTDNCFHPESILSIIEFRESLKQANIVQQRKRCYSTIGDVIDFSPSS